jgi:hypothetical protein
LAQFLQQAFFANGCVTVWTTGVAVLFASLLATSASTRCSNSESFELACFPAQLAQHGFFTGTSSLLLAAAPQEPHKLLSQVHLNPHGPHSNPRETDLAPGGARLGTTPFLTALRGTTNLDTLNLAPHGPRLDSTVSQQHSQELQLHCVTRHFSQPAAFLLRSACTTCFCEQGGGIKGPQHPTPFLTRGPTKGPGPLQGPIKGPLYGPTKGPLYPSLRFKYPARSHNIYTF